MYHRDQQENRSLSSYFDQKDRTVPAITTPVSPLATTVAVATPQSKNDQHSESSTASSWSTTGGEQTTLMALHTGLYALITLTQNHVNTVHVQEKGSSNIHLLTETA